MLTPTLQKVIAVVVAVAGAFFVVVGIRMWIRTEGLMSRAAVTQARLTDIRKRVDSETGLVATYEFEVGGTRFHRVGLFGEVPADITPAQASDPSGTIRVRYLPEDPWVNEPVSDVTPTATKQLFAIALGLGMMAVAVMRWRSARGAPRASTAGPTDLVS